MPVYERYATTALRDLRIGEELDRLVGAVTLPVTMIMAEPASRMKNRPPGPIRGRRRRRKRWPRRGS